MADEPKRKIGLFGGTFDPIHTGHLIVAEIIRDALDLEKVFFIPVKRHPFKDNDFIAHDDHRYRMIQLAISDNKHLAVSDIELKSDGISYTVETIEKIRNEYPEERWDIYFLMGMDNLNQLHRWREPETLVKMCKVVVFSRPGFEPRKEAQKFLDSVQIIPTPLLEISSTQIRNRIKQAQTVRYLVPPRVESYIRTHKLYKG